MKNYKSYIMEALLKLYTPNEFEIYEFLEEKQISCIQSNNSIDNIRYFLSKLIEENVVVMCQIKSNRYSKRYRLTEKKPYCIIEPFLLRRINNSTNIIREAKTIVYSGKRRQLTNGIKLIPDPLREIVIAIENESLLGVIDFRYHLSQTFIRFPTRFYQQSGKEGMTELKYFSRLVNKIKGKGPTKSWLSVNCRGVTP